MEVRRGPKPLDISGKVFGRWTVVSQSPVSRLPTKWTCRCECGAEKDVAVTALRNGKSQSCGCLHRERVSAAGRKDPVAVGMGRLYAHCRGSAASQGHEFALSREEWGRIVESPCYLCGDPPPVRDVKGGENQRRVYAEGEPRPRYYRYHVRAHGVDRVDSARGYTRDNVRACCTACNRMKLDHPLPFFYAHVEKIVAHRRTTRAD